MTIRHKNAWEMQNVFEIGVKLFRLWSKFTGKYTNQFRRSAVSVHSTDAFRHATELMGTAMWSFCQHTQFYFGERRCCLDSVVEKVIMQMQKKTQRHTRSLAAQFIDFLHALEYQHINYTLEWYLQRCFYPRIRNFRKKFWNAVRDYFKEMFALIRKQHIIFRKLVRKIFYKITLVNATCFK